MWFSICVVPITPFLIGQAFEPEDIQAMSAAFISACEKLRLTDRNDPFIEIVAGKVIELAQRGVRDPEALRKRVLAEFNIRD
jgi:hypothetical protein